MPRRSIYIDDIAHKSPIPNASRIGNFIASGLIRGPNPDGSFPETIEEQCTLMLANVRRTVEAGGGRVEDIVKVTFWMEKLSRPPINTEWVKMFPDPASRPARQVMETSMEPGVLIQCDFLAVVQDRH
jgi:2-iminobutanoate/2-iminopropanoate deaminase